MKKTLKNIASSLLIFSSIFSQGIMASEYPSRPVTFVVPWPPGDLEDLLTRLISQEMQAQTRKPSSVVNKAGGGGVIGALDVARSRSDGYMVGSFVSDLLTTQILAGNAPYDRSTFEPVGIFLEYPFVLATKSSQPYSSLNELAEYSKNNTVTLGHFGYQALPTALTFKAALKLGIKFSSDSPFDNTDCPVLLNGDADVVTTTISQIQACLKTGEVKLLASITRDRLSISPETPTLNELTGITQTTWNGLFVKAGTPAEIKNKIASIAEAAVTSAKAQSYVGTTGAGIFWMGEDEAKKLIEKDYEAAEELLKYMKD